MQTKHILSLLFILFSTVVFSQKSDAFYLIGTDHTTSIQFDSREKEVVKTAIELFSTDMKTIGDAVVKQYNNFSKTPSYLIVAGTIGSNNIIDSLISKGEFSAEDIKNKWEAFRIKCISQKNGKQKLLLVVGSDSRGTAYGILELSRMAGVSPWNWWADVIPDKRKTITLNSTINIVQAPSVQYRGIFLNDEDWGIEPWANKTLDKSSKKGVIGPMAYQKVFELLLRLRANTIWPAMHESTVPFFLVKGNKEMADRYGIVVGTSHCEPMMRCSASEWHLKGVGEYNYAVNAQNVDNYWIDRVKQLSSSENIYTLGMRGLHDGNMLGATTVDEQVTLTNKVLKSQRGIIGNYLNPTPSKIPQVFIPYKEVLDIYNTGKLELPEDVSLIWCDDNFGYISRLSTPVEQARSGGSGVYYHASYWGSPHDYLWLCTTPPAQVVTEMKRAWEYNARKLWILNVGDLKPAEYITELFLDLAWNIESVNQKTVQAHTQNWISQQFGKKYASEISCIMKEYYHLATIRKPEHMGWSRIQTSGFPKGFTPVINTEFTPFAFGNELQKRISEYQTIEDKVEELSKKMAVNRKDAFFELVKYPVQGASLLNKKLLYAQMYRELAPLNLPSANEYAKLSQLSLDKIEQLTDVFNHQIADGKWNEMMDCNPRKLPVYQRLELPKVNIANQQGIVVFADGHNAPIQPQKTYNTPAFVQSTNNNYVFTIYQKAEKIVTWSIAQKPIWVTSLVEKQLLNGEERIQLKINWDKVSGSSQKGHFVIQSGSEKFIFNLEVFKTLPNQIGKPMTDGFVSFNANECQNRNSVHVTEIPGLGHSFMVLKVDSGNKKSALEYAFNSTKIGEVSVCIALYPNHPANGRNKRYAVAIDEEEPQIIETESDIFKENWKVNVLRNQSRTTTTHKIEKAGKHVLKFYAIDPDIILDQLFVDFKADRKFYQIPDLN
jgi:hypothetical protein